MYYFDNNLMDKYHTILILLQDTSINTVKSDTKQTTGSNKRNA
jgi:hypothetical protein